MNALRIAASAFTVLIASMVQQVCARALSDFKIGDSIANTEKLGPPLDTGTYKIYSMKKWRLANGNEFNVSHTADGKIAYIEADWGHGSASRETGLFGFTFGATTLEQIREKLGSNGIMFKQRAPVFEIGSGMGLMNAYEVGDTVVSFITVLPRAEFDEARAENTEEHDAIAAHAKLDAVIIASGTYVDSDWGGRVYDKAYKKVAPP